MQVEGTKKEMLERHLRVHFTAVQFEIARQRNKGPDGSLPFGHHLLTVSALLKKKYIKIYILKWNVSFSKRPPLKSFAQIDQLEIIYF